MALCLHTGPEKKRKLLPTCPSNCHIQAQALCTTYFTRLPNPPRDKLYNRPSRPEAFHKLHLSLFSAQFSLYKIHHKRGDETHTELRPSDRLNHGPSARHAVPWLL